MLRLRSYSVINRRLTEDIFKQLKKLEGRKEFLIGEWEDTMAQVNPCALERYTKDYVAVPANPESNECIIIGRQLNWFRILGTEISTILRLMEIIDLPRHLIDRHQKEALARIEFVSQRQKNISEN